MNNQLLEQDEELLPELFSFVQTSRSGTLLLSHPYYFSIISNSDRCGLINRQFTEKKTMMDSLWQEGEFDYFIWQHEIPYRLDAFVQWTCNHPLRDRIPNKKYWETLRDIWISEPMPHEKIEIWKRLLSSYRDERRWFMTGSEAAFLRDNADATLTVYRGINGQFYNNGISWTLNRQVAINIARGSSLGNPRVLTGTVDVYNVFAYIQARLQEEIISTHVNIISMEEL